MMWQHRNSLFLILLLLCPPIAGAEMISGTVLQVERDRGDIVLKTARDREIQVHTTSPLPRRVQAGREIRAWGEFTADDQFQATDIRGPGRHHGLDPTGVRLRLHKGRQCSRHQDGVSREPDVDRP